MSILILISHIQVFFVVLDFFSKKKKKKTKNAIAFGHFDNICTFTICLIILWKWYGGKKPASAHLAQKSCLSLYFDAYEDNFETDKEFKSSLGPKLIVFIRWSKIYFQKKILKSLQTKTCHKWAKFVIFLGAFWFNKCLVFALIIEQNENLF